nr:uncharacterized protein F21D5.5 [Onthophagus taurus]
MKAFLNPIKINQLKGNYCINLLAPRSLSKMSNKATSCYLKSIKNPETKLTLENNKLFELGRNEPSKIIDPKVSRKQLLLKANYESRIVKCVANGTNLSGCDGFALVENKMYLLNNNSILEVLIGIHQFEIIFEPKILEEPPTKKPKIVRALSEESGLWETIDQSLLIYTSPQFLDSSFGTLKDLKVAGFDMDGTLITTKSGQRFPVDYKDWKLWSPEVKLKLNRLSDKGYMIVIFSNQLRLGKENAKYVPFFKKKIENISKEFNVPLKAFIATQRDIYRKPAPGMWDVLKRSYPNINDDESIFVGDAAGREKNWGVGKKKDHSLADRLFALNIGIKFKTPEEFFLEARSVPFQMPSFDPRNLSCFNQEIPLESDKQEVIMMVGCQGSGKSYFYQQNIAPHGYILINRDMLGSKEKCLRLLDEALKTGKCVTIDNTHPNKESRAQYLNVCKNYDVPVKCFVMKVPSKQIKHNNYFRTITDKNHAVISDILINTYLKNFQYPDLNEGFTKIYEFEFNPKFKNVEDEKLYKMFLLET